MIRRPPRSTRTDHSFPTRRSSDLQAMEFLWTVRIHLHYLASRPEERLTFDMQTEIAKAMGYADRPGRLDVERFMKKYYLVAKEVGDLTDRKSTRLNSSH